MQTNEMKHHEINTNEMENVSGGSRRAIKETENRPCLRKDGAGPFADREINDIISVY